MRGRIGRPPNRDRLPHGDEGIDGRGGVVGVWSRGRRRLGRQEGAAMMVGHLPHIDCGGVDHTQCVGGLRGRLIAIGYLMETRV